MSCDEAAGALLTRLAQLTGVVRGLVDLSPKAGTKPPPEDLRRSGRSKRTRFMTLSQAATKSRTNLSRASSQAYISAIARNCEFDPKTRSTVVAVHLVMPVARSRPSKTPSDLADGCHTVCMS